MTSLKHFLTFFTAIVLIFSANLSLGQCSSTVDFSGWTRYGDVNCVWVPQTPPTSVMSGNVAPFWYSFFVGPDTFMNVRITGSFQVQDFIDDDYVGFVFGYKQPLTTGTNNSTHTHDYWLFDWKQTYQNYFGWIAQQGKSLNRVNGSFTMSQASSFPGFWVHGNSPTFQVLASSWGAGTGYADFTTYNMELLLTPTRVKIFINNVLLFDQSGCFEPGLFGFYEMSQVNILYSNFSYELYTDFQIEEDICFGDTSFITLFDTSCYAGNALTNIDTFYWDLGDGTITNDTNPIHLYATPDTFNVSLIATDIYGCIDTNTKQIRVHQIPSANFNSSLSCLGDSTSFFDASTNLDGQVISWDWNFGDGLGFSNDTNPTYAYTNAGTYPVTFAIETEFGCLDSVVQNITVVTPPNANFSIASACDGSPVQFTNLSSSTSYAIASYAWDFENNQSIDAMSFNASHTYPIFDIYAVKLEVTDVYGCVDSIIKVVDVHPNPSVAFTAPATCLGDSSFFFDASSVVNGNITDWMWILNGGNDTVYGQNAGFKFPTLGYHPVLLYATTDSGCVDFSLQSTLVRDLPQANFTASTACGNEATHFQQQCYTPVGVVNHWYWDFGNGTDTNANPNYVFGTYGPQTVQLAIETNFGCRDTIQNTVFVYPVPQPIFSWDNDVCEGENLQFFDQSVITQVSQTTDVISNWFWDIDGSQYNVQNPVFQTLTSDIIPVKLRVTSNHGCKDSLLQNASVFPKPKVNFQADENCAQQETQFTSLSTVSSGLLSQHRWYFSNGLTSLNPNPSVYFDSSGIYFVTLKVITNAGCIDSVIRPIEIPETPLAKFSIIDSVGCSPFGVRIENQSTITTGTMTYKWLVDGQFLTALKEPIISIENDGVEPLKSEIKLIATSGIGCSTEFISPVEVTVLPKPTAAFTMLKDTLEPLDDFVTLTNSSKQGVKWLWKFGNGDTSSEFEPIYSYPESGTYIIQLVAENIWKCQDSIELGITVDPFITMYIPNSFTPNGDGINDTWKIKGFNEGREYAVRVFDRWGGLLFYSNDLKTSWDGTDARTSTLVPGGVYIYQVKYYYGKDQVIEKKGEITVVR